MENIITLIQNFGFPIACCIVMFVMLYNEQKAHKEETEKLSETMTELKIEFKDAINNQKSEMVQAINNNTLVIQKLLDRIDEK